MTLGLINGDSLDAQDDVLIREAVLGWLAQPLRSHKYRETEKKVYEASWLLVFDGADDVRLLDDFWPYGTDGSVLVTSRAPLETLGSFTGGPRVVMPPFQPCEAIALLLSLTKRHDSDEDRAYAKDVVECVGHIPLAVEQVAGLIVRTNITFAEFLKDYNSTRDQGNPQTNDDKQLACLLV